MRKSTLAILLIALCVSGCNRSANVLSSVNTQAPPQALPSVPAGSIQSSQLDPLTGANNSSGVINSTNGQTIGAPSTRIDANGNLITNPDTFNNTALNNNTLNSPTLDGVTEEANAVLEKHAAATPQPTTSNKPLKHVNLAGAWNVNTDNAGCRAILSFTQWSGGYRGTTKNCNSPTLKAVKAWDIKGSQVVLVDTNGAQVAALSATGDSRYAGQTATGEAITFTR